MIKDSAIWISLSASIFNIEVYRVLITKDSVILLNKQEKEVQYRSLDYLQEVTEIPFDYKTLQDLLVGNPVFFDSNIISYKKTDDQDTGFSMVGFFKNLVTLSLDNNLLSIVNWMMWILPGTEQLILLMMIMKIKAELIFPPTGK